jgi:protein-tyrosine phosphatase
MALTEQDLNAAGHIVALKYAEHHPLISRNFPDWINRVEYWHVHDIDQAAPEEALPQIEMAVQALLARLAGQLP